ncbi:MAG: hypothetical protein R2712_04675 [Vicinamibacterales bacterium]
MPGQGPRACRSHRHPRAVPGCAGDRRSRTSSRSPPSCAGRSTISWSPRRARDAIQREEGQFTAPRDMRHVVGKLADAGNTDILLTERGTTFGYNNLVVDMRGLPMLRALGYPVVFDVTQPAAAGRRRRRDRRAGRCIEPLAQAGVGAGVDGVFMEGVHEEPSRAGERS